MATCITNLKWLKLIDAYDGHVYYKRAVVTWRTATPGRPWLTVHVYHKAHGHVMDMHDYYWLIPGERNTLISRFRTTGQRTKTAGVQQSSKAKNYSYNSVQNEFAG